MTIPVSRWVSGLLAGVVVLMLLHLLRERLPWQLDQLFDVDRETNIPTWYSTVLLICVALTAGGICRRRTTVGERRFWMLYALLYGFLSMDEAACVHEHLNWLTGVKWVYFYAPMGAAVFLACACFLGVRASRRVMCWILGGMGVYALGGLLGEYISYRFRPLPPGWQLLEFLWEEGLEMAGTILVLGGCLQEWNRPVPSTEP